MDRRHRLRRGEHNETCKDAFSREGMEQPLALDRLGRFGVSLSLVVAIVHATGACAVPVGVRRVTPIVAADSFARAAIEREATLDPADYPRLSIAVPPLRTAVRDSSLSVLGFGLADLIMTDLARSAQLTVVERLRLDAVIREQELATLGRVDSAFAARTGKLVGARTLLIGDVVEGDDGGLQVGTRLVNVVDASTGDGPSATSAVNGILDAQKQLVFDVFDRLGVTLTPRERTLISERPTQNLAALLAYSRGVRAQAFGDFTRARTEFRAAGVLDRGFRQARVRAQEASAAMGEPTTADAGSRISSISTLSTDLVNRPSVPLRNDIADPAFTNARRLASLIINITVP